MSTFADKIRKVQTEASSKIDEKKKAIIENRKDELFSFLTSKYHPKIKRGISSAASKGLSEKFMNFDKNDFKANCNGLGFPKDIQSLWLTEVILNKDEKKYLPINEDTKEPDHLNGINFQILNNEKFTTRFYW